MGVETGGCPHTAIREDASINLEAVDQMCRRFPDLQIIFIESGGDNLAATFSPELSDLTLYVIDVAGGEKIPRKGGPGITKSDLLVINKTDLAPHVGANLDVMRHDTERMRGARPYAMTNLKSGAGLDAVIDLIERQGLLQGEPSLLAEAAADRLSSRARRSNRRGPTASRAVHGEQVCAEHVATPAYAQFTVTKCVCPSAAMVDMVVAEVLPLICASCAAVSVTKWL